MTLSSKVAVVVLNYMTTKEPALFLSSFYKSFSDIPVFVVDNGSSWRVKKYIAKEVKKYNKAKLISLTKNNGFAGGMNYGIKAAQEKGFDFIAISNSDITFPDKEIFTNLLLSYRKTRCAAIGPSIITPKGDMQNPFLIKRPSEKEAKHIFNTYSTKAGIARVFILNWFYEILGKSKYERIKKYAYFLSKGKFPPLPEKKIPKKNARWNYVYALHGAFILLCPPFFSHFKGLYNKTFLYGEELIMAEQLFKKKESMVYDSSSLVRHSEDATSNLVWGGSGGIKKLLIMSRSISLWYNDIYNK